MSILPQLEHDLLQAAERRPSRATADVRASRGSWRRARRFWFALPALGLLLATATIALAATGVILTGSAVPPTGPLNPAVGEGVPKPGRSALLPLRVPDPEGGLPWGMRVIATSRGLLCLQVGRVQAGELGELGIDGAFHDDGRFHPLPADVLPADATSGVDENTNCHLAGETFAGELGGLDRNATASEYVPTSPRQDLRDVSYGDLGAHAVSVTYLSDGRQRVEPVLPGVGAYLIVQRTAAHEQIGTSGGSSGIGQLDAPRPNPDGALTAIAYRFNGRLCEDSLELKVADPCPRPRLTRVLRPLPPIHLHRPVHVRLELHGQLIVGAELSFIAPFAVTSAREGYAIAMPSPCHQGTIERSVDRDVVRGSTVRVALQYPFANACGPTVLVEVLYGAGARPGPGRRDFLIGATTLRAPPGTRPAPPPIR